MNFSYIKPKLLLVALILLAPACKWRKSKSASTSKAQASQTTLAGKPGLFEEADLDGFVLTTSETSNSFGPQNGALLFEDDDILLADMNVEQSRHGFRTVYFEFDKSNIRPGQQAALEHDLARAKELTHQGKTVVIEGHSCCFAGSDKYNMQLSERRARFVHHYFVKNGIPRSKLKVVGRGCEMKIVPYGDLEQQAPNRRVEFLVID